MKILAIRGKNLASLSADFEVDYQQEPLLSAGLYAITGPTGAGKSTLLDALCLALYERTPRLRFAGARGETIPDVCDNDIAPGDPRTILRRGAGEGYAEVDFMGSDAVAYRSRWSVRRARGKGLGKLQHSEITFTRIADGQTLGDHRKTETLHLIEKAIGLSFEQFTRAVLLAQNDFAAFLKASDDERAELLQTLTGTSQFSDLSMRAYQRMKDEKSQLDQLHNQLKSQAALLPDERIELELQVGQKAGEVGQIETNKAGLEAQLRWHRQLTTLMQAEALASQALDAAVAVRNDAAQRQSELSHIEQVREARPLWLEVQRLQGDIEKQRHAGALANLALELANTQLVTRAQAMTGLAEAVAGAEDRQRQALPQLDAAKELDVKIATLQPPLAAAIRAKEQAAKALEGSQTQLKDRRDQLKQIQEIHGATEHWLQQHAQLQALAQSWPRLATLFELALQQKDDCAKCTSQHLTFVDRACILAGDRAKAQRDLNDVQRAYDSAVSSLLASNQAVAQFDPVHMAEQRQSLDVQRERLQSASLLWQQFNSLRQGFDRNKQQRQTETVLMSTSQVDLKQAEDLIPMLDRDYAAAEQALQIAQLAASKGVESLRATLQAGAPCPVCGAAEHPYADHNPHDDVVLNALKENLQGKRDDRQALTRRMGILSGQVAAARAQVERLAAELELLTQARAQWQAAWDGHALHPELAAVAQDQIQPWLDREQNNAKLDMATMAEQEAALQRAIKAKDAHLAARDQAQGALQIQQQTLQTLQLEVHSNDHSLQAVMEQVETLRRQLSNTLGQIDTGFTDTHWRDRWMQDADDFVAQCRQDALNWNHRQQQLIDFQRQQQALDASVASLEQTLQKDAEVLDESTRRCAEEDVALQAIRAQREAFFAGKGTQAVEAGLRTAVNQARDAHGQAQTLWQLAVNEQTRQAEVHRLGAERLLKDTADLALAQSRFDAWLEAFRARVSQAAPDVILSAHTLQVWLEVTPQWLATERSELQALASTVDSTAAVLAQQRRTLATHRALYPTSDDADTVSQNLAQLLQTLQTASADLTACQLQLAEDDKKLKASVAVRALIEAQAARARVWGQLGELIGSADGKKFRNFAQQLTLDILLGYANSHLQSLTRRYRLQRIKDSLGLLVVDQDMGDEVRSVHSLSGGESFLVSLALALGLASLSSHQVRVESLFIDEGFGSLDAEALLLAMEALDKLQAQGRKVGVISHVQEMTERIGTRVQVKRLAGGMSRVVVG